MDSGPCAVRGPLGMFCLACISSGLYIVLKNLNLLSTSSKPDDFHKQRQKANGELRENVCNVFHKDLISLIYKEL